MLILHELDCRRFETYDQLEGLLDVSGRIRLTGSSSREGARFAASELLASAAADHEDPAVRSQMDVVGVSCPGREVPAEAH